MELWEDYGGKKSVFTLRRLNFGAMAEPAVEGKKTRKSGNQKDVGHEKRNSTHYHAPIKEHDEAIEFTIL